MAEKTSISTAFYMQVVTMLTIGSVSVLGFRFMASENKTAINEAVTEAVTPLVERIEALEEQVADLAPKAEACYLSANIFVSAYNRVNHKEFLRPLDLREETVKPKRKNKSS